MVAWRYDFDVNASIPAYDYPCSLAMCDGTVQSGVRTMVAHFIGTILKTPLRWRGLWGRDGLL